MDKCLGYRRVGIEEDPYFRSLYMFFECPLTRDCRWLRAGQVV